MLGIIFDSLTMVVAVGLKLLQAFKLVSGQHQLSRENELNLLRSFVVYLSLLVVIRQIESTFFIITYIPFYSVFRTLLHVYLVYSPDFAGTWDVYGRIEPTLYRFQPQMEHYSALIEGLLSPQTFYAAFQMIVEKFRRFQSGDSGYDQVAGQSGHPPPHNSPDSPSNAGGNLYQTMAWGLAALSGFASNPQGGQPGHPSQGPNNYNGRQRPLEPTAGNTTGFSLGGLFPLIKSVVGGDLTGPSNQARGFDAQAESVDPDRTPTPIQMPSMPSTTQQAYSRPARAASGNSEGFEQVRHHSRVPSGAFGQESDSSSLGSDWYVPPGDRSSRRGSNAAPSGPIVGQSTGIDY